MDLTSIKIQYQPIFPLTKEIIISSDFITLKKNMKIQKTVNLRDFDGIRYGIRWISFLIPLGLKFIIKIKPKDGKPLIIYMYSIFGLQHKKQHHKLKEIHASIWEKFLQEKCLTLLAKLEKGETIQFDHININKHQFSLIDKNKKIKSYFITDIDIVEFRTFYTLVTKSNRKPILDLDYLTNWHAAIIYTLIKSINNLTPES